MFITLVLAPIFFSIRANTSENKRLDILLNKTREELAGKYVTKTELANDIGRILSSIGKLEKKIDKLFDK
jgi:peptidoglycan hydrolase CwlO-like protein